MLSEEQKLTPNQKWAEKSIGVSEAEQKDKDIEIAYEDSKVNEGIFTKKAPEFGQNESRIFRAIGTASGLVVRKLRGRKRQNGKEESDQNTSTLTKRVSDLVGEITRKTPMKLNSKKDKGNMEPKENIIRDLKEGKQLLKYFFGTTLVIVALGGYLCYKKLFDK